jgi:hypothetical protein
MSAAILLAIGALATSGVDVVEEERAERLFVPAFRAGAGATPEQAAVLTDAVLEAARRLFPDVGFVGESELTGLLDLEAQKQVAGCESDLSCLSELADALNAPELLSGSLARLGSTWVLDLKRVDQGGVIVRGQVQLKRAGLGVDVLLPEIDGGVRALFAGDPVVVVEDDGGSAWPWIAMGSGAAVAAAGGVVFAFALDNADFAKNGGLDQNAHDLAVDQGHLLEATSYTAWGVGGALMIGGVALMFVE